MRDIGWLTAQLPEHRSIQRRTEADYYGASDLVASALGKSAPPPCIASWKHGVSYEQDLRFPELILTEGNRATRHLVGNGTQAVQLNRRGYLRVHAVGVPYLYVEPFETKRLPRTLLVMPAHSLSNTSHAFDEEGYVDQLQSIAGNFDAIVACIAPPCVRSGTWTRSFEKRGIPWIPGADSNDRNALRRMARIFATFEFVTGNTLGSHIAYAAYSGCRVSIWGPYAEYKLEHFRGVPWYEKHWSKLGDLFDRLSESYIRGKFGWLFRNPWEADANQEWARPLLGEQHKRGASEMARLLGWTATGRAEYLMHRAARKCHRLGTVALQRARGDSASARGA